MMDTPLKRVLNAYIGAPDRQALRLARIRAVQAAGGRLRSLLRRLCPRAAGDCLVLDCPCPQLQSHSLKCRYFRDAVLPGDKELYAAVMGQGGIKTCASCGKPFRAVANRAKYCDGCRVKVHRKQQAASARKKYHENLDK